MNLGCRLLGRHDLRHALEELPDALAHPLAPAAAPLRSKHPLAVFETAGLADGKEMKMEGAGDRGSSEKDSIPSQFSSYRYLV